MQSIAIDDLKLAEAFLAGERRLLEMVATGEPLADVLHALCNIAEATGSGAHCSILLIDSDAKFHFGAGPSVPPGYAKAIEDVPVMPEVGPCGMAASLKRQVVVDDLVAGSLPDLVRMAERLEIACHRPDTTVSIGHDT
jgi:hypothetical protein